MRAALVASICWAACMALYYAFLGKREYVFAAIAAVVSLLIARFIMSPQERDTDEPRNWVPVDRDKEPESPKECNHAWDRCICRLCGLMRDSHHDWVCGQCSRCFQEHRDARARWPPITTGMAVSAAAAARYARLSTELRAAPVATAGGGRIPITNGMAVCVAGAKQRILRGPPPTTPGKVAGAFAATIEDLTCL
jgi:hypothetical protein